MICLFLCSTTPDHKSRLISAKKRERRGDQNGAAIFDPCKRHIVPYYPKIKITLPTRWQKTQNRVTLFYLIYSLTILDSLRNSPIQSPPPPPDNLFFPQLFDWPHFPSQLFPPFHALNLTLTFFSPDSSPQNSQLSEKFSFLPHFRSFSISPHSFFFFFFFQSPPIFFHAFLIWSKSSFDSLGLSLISAQNC